MRLGGVITIGFIALMLVLAAFHVDGVTWQWTCEDYALRKAREAYEQGYRPYDSYSFVGLGIGMCTPEYSNK